jgi:hypothetical protein
MDLEPTRWAKYANNPVAFARDFWPTLKIALYQREILESVAANPETWVHSGHKLGKTRVAAVAAIWFFLTRRARVYLIARTERNLETALWPAIVQQINRATIRDPDSPADDPQPLRDAMGNPVPPPFQLKVIQLQVQVIEPDGRTDPNYFIRGFLQNDPEAISGQHLPRQDDGTPTVLVIVDEASNQESWLYETITAYAHRILEIGNPIHSVGTFHEKCTGGDVYSKPEDQPDAPPRLERRVIHVSAEDSPNVKVGRARAKRGLPPVDLVPGIINYLDYQRFMRIWPAHKRRWGLDGLFPDESTNRLFPKEWMELAHGLYEILRRHNAELIAKGRRPKYGWPLALGVDCGRSKLGDLTSFTVVGRYGWVFSLSKHIHDTMETYRTILKLARRFKIAPEFIALDQAIGGPIADQLRSRREWDVADVNFGAKDSIDREKYENMRAHMYGEVAAAMELRYREDEQGQQRLRGRLQKMLITDPDRWPKGWMCVAIPREETELVRELLVLPRQHSQRTGALLLPPKEPRPGKSRAGEFCLRELLGRSPDRGDSFVLGYYALQRGLEIRRLQRVDHPLAY